MKKNGNIKKSGYTLIEIISAMAVFMIICLVVLRFFNGAQQLTSASNSRNEMYADVRAFFDILGSDLQAIVYNNQISIQGNHPFVNSFYPIENSGFSPFTSYLTNIENFYDENMIPVRLRSEFAFKIGTHNSRNYVPLLCFMANPSHMPQANEPLCEIRYTFTPMGARLDSKTPPQIAKFNYRSSASGYPGITGEFKGGKILRSITYADSGKNHLNTHRKPVNRHPHDAENFPLVDQDGEATVLDTSTSPKYKARTQFIFGDASSFPYEEVIGHVYRMNITCYKLDPLSNRYLKIRMYNIHDINTDVPSTQDDFYNDNSVYFDWPPSSPNELKYPVNDTRIELLQLGHPLPDMVKVDLYMLSPKDWNLLMAYYNFNTSKFSDEAAARKILSLKLRHFSRTFYINNVDAGK